MRAPPRDGTQTPQHGAGGARGTVWFPTEHGAHPASGAASGGCEPLIPPKTTAIFLVRVSLVISTCSVFVADTAPIHPAALPAPVALLRGGFAGLR